MQREAAIEINVVIATNGSLAEDEKNGSSG